MLKKLMILTLVGAIAAFAVIGPVNFPDGANLITVPSPRYNTVEHGEVTPVSFTEKVFLGEGEQAGVTTYDYQQNGPMGNRVMVDPEGNVHLCWMHSESETFATRDVYYNYWDGSFAWGSSGTRASSDPYAGYTTMGILSDGSAVVGYHHDPGGDGTYFSAVSIDASPGAGLFSAPINVDQVTVPEQPIWPHIAVDEDNVIHVTAHCSGTHFEIPNSYVNYYSRSTDEGGTFSEWESFTENCGNDVAVATSKDGKVGIAWISSVPMEDSDVKGSGGHVYYIESTNNGASWSSPRKVTEGRYPDVSPNDPEGDFYIWAWPRDLDCCYDSDGNLHIAWGEGFRRFTIQNDTSYFSFYYPFFNRIAHWDDATEEFTLPSGPFPQFHAIDQEGDTIIAIDSLALWGIAEGIQGYFVPGLGCWNPQLAAFENKDAVVCTWQGQWDTLDVTLDGSINADIYAAITTGDPEKPWAPFEDWNDDDLEQDSTVAYFTNLTNTHSPGVVPPNSQSEEYHSVYPWIEDDSTLHITYIDDLYAGSGIPQHVPTGGIVTVNPVRYMTYKAKEGKYFSAVAETPPTPARPIRLIGAHPASDVVTFSLGAPVTDGSFKVFDAAGNLVEVLFEGSHQASTLNWNTTDVASGVYFYSFTTPHVTHNGRVVVIH